MKEWYEEAATKLYNYFVTNFHAKEVLKDIKEDEKTDIRFHFNTGMAIRNTLRELGYDDDMYGNLDDHYIEILNMVYVKVGL